MKKIGIYDPYFHILGGAERYVLSIAQCFPEDKITLFGVTLDQLNKANDKFGLHLKNIITSGWTRQRNQRRKILQEYEQFFYVTDGSLFFPSAKKNMLIVQTPDHIPSTSFINKLKLRNWKLICYSRFMQKIILERLGRKSDILFVPVQRPSAKLEKKENLIVSVGRFFPHLHNKKQLELVEIFRELIDEGLKDTAFYVVGSIDPGGEKYFQDVVKAAVGLPIKIISDADFSSLDILLQKAKVFWHAAGYGEDLVKHPERAEHFGVVTLEAMIRGTVPVVFNAGGQAELVKHNRNGYVWETKTELKHHTRELLDSPKVWKQLSQSAIKTAFDYTREKFCKKLYEILER